MRVKGEIAGHNPNLNVYSNYGCRDGTSAIDSSFEGYLADASCNQKAKNSHP
jgi:hypothetical protein